MAPTSEGSPAATPSLSDDSAAHSDSTFAPTLAGLTVLGVASAIGVVLSAAVIANGDAEEAGRLGIAIAGVVLGAIGLAAVARLVRRVIRQREERLTLPFQYEILLSKLEAERSKLDAESSKDDAELKPTEDVAARYEEKAEALHARLMAAGMASEAHELAMAMARVVRREAR
jgi:hypothetical protein